MLFGAIGASAMLLPIAGAMADVIAHQSFEYDGTGGKYYDTGDAAVDHQLFNNPGEAWVDYDGADGSMAFNAWYFNTRNSSGLVDGDYVGVTSFTGSGVGAYTDGVQGYQFSDTDGYMEIQFGSVDLSSWTNVKLTFDIFVQSTGWETSDHFAFGMNGSDLYSTAGSDIDDLGLEGLWTSFEYDLGDLASGALSIGLDSNAANEAIFIDNIVFSGDYIPAPGALALLAIAGLAARRRRR